MIELNRDLRDHDFLPADISMIPALYETEDVEIPEKMVQLHYFIPQAMQAFDWWVVEYDPAQRLAFGYACLNGDTLNAEWGYISLEELEGLLASHPTPVFVVRDLDFTPKPWAEVLANWKR